MTETADPINCPFCYPQERVLQQNDLAQVILSDPHKVPGHLLIMPKRHVERPWDLTHDEFTNKFFLDSKY